VRSCRASNADGAESAGNGQWSTDRVDYVALSRGRMYVSAASGRQRAVRVGAVAGRQHAGNVQRPAAGGAKQSGRLRADRYAIGDYVNANARYGAVRMK